MRSLQTREYFCIFAEKFDRYDRELQSYTLRFPNREVEIGFAEELLPMYVKGAENTDSPFAFLNFKDDLVSGNPEIQKLK